MPDREKLIRGLQNRINESRNHGGIAVTVALSTLSGALMLLKEQEPQETRFVRHYSRPGVYADLWLYCEKCGGRVDDEFYRPKFCPECGRKVKWDEAD